MIAKNTTIGTWFANVSETLHNNVERRIEKDARVEVRRYVPEYSNPTCPFVYVVRPVGSDWPWNTALCAKSIDLYNMQLACADTSEGGAK